MNSRILAPKRGRRAEGLSATNRLTESLEPRRLLSVNVTTYHNDGERDGLNSQETQLTLSNVNTSTFGKLFEHPLDGEVYAQPLVMTNVAIPGKGTHDVVYVVTEHDSVYAFDADSNAGSNALPLWSDSFIDPARGLTTIPSTDVDSGDLVPEIGITGTPVIDPTTNTMYVVADTKQVTDGVTTYAATLHALDITTGAEKLGGPVVLSGSVKGTGAGTVNGTVAFQALWGNQRPALTLSNGVVYIAFAAHGDQGPYHGWVMAYSAATLKQVGIFNATPDGKGAGIWMSGDGLSVDPEGRIFVTTANGDFNGTTEWGDSVLQLSLGTSGLTVADSFTPYNQATLSDTDQDLGSGGILILPTQPGPYPHEGIFAGKAGTVYVVNLDKLGGYNPKADTAVIQELNGVISRDFCAMAYYDGRVYIHPTAESVDEFTLTNGLLSKTPVAKAVHFYNYPGATPSISSNGDTNGIIWEIEPGNPAILHAYNALTLAEIYNSGMAGTRDEPNFDAIKFTTPTIANGKVYVGTGGSLAVFGLFPKEPAPPAAPTDFSVVATSASTISLSFAEASQDETDFQILRSTDDKNFDRVNDLPAGVTSYVDVDLNPSTTYYYRLLAENTAGKSAETPIVSAETFAQPNLTGIVGYWRFDEANGTVAHDSSPTGESGTIVGEITRVPGYVGPGALSFHGTGVAPSEVQIPDKPVWNFTASQSFTVSAWIDPERLNNELTGVIAKSYDIAPGYGIDISAKNQWEFYGSTPVVGNLVTLGWHYVAIVQDASVGKRYLYVDGKLVGTGAAQNGDGNGDLWIGTNRDSYIYFPGIIDEVRIYDLALTATEINSIIADINPGPVTLVSVTPTSSTSATLTWTKSTGVADYTIQMLTASGSFNNDGQATASQTQFVVSGLTPGDIYTYRILAYNAAGQSGSQSVAVTMPTATKPTPLSVTLKYVDSNKPYELTTAEVGASLWVDATTKITALSSELVGGVLIKTADSDRHSTVADQLTFTANQSVTVYVAYDNSAKILPLWLAGWTRTKLVFNGETVYSKSYASGDITLGGNLESPASGAQYNYDVIVQPASN